MQSFPRLVLVGLAAIALAAPVAGERSDDQINPKSVALMHQGQALMSAGKLEEAEKPRSRSIRATAGPIPTSLASRRSSISSARPCA